MRRKDRETKEKGIKKAKRAGEKSNEERGKEEIERISPLFLSGDWKVPLK